MQKFLFPILTIVAFLAFWEMGSRLSNHIFSVLPAPTDIIWQLWVKSDRFFFHTSQTLKVIVGGFLLAFILGFPLAWMMSIRKEASLVLQPLFILTQCVPMFALA